VLAVVVVAAVAVGAVLFVRSRQVERSTEALCAELTAAQDLDQSFTTLDPTTLDPQVTALRKAAEVAPSDIAPSVDTLAEFVGELADAVDDAGGDPTEALTTALEARQDRVDAVTAAGSAVQAWAAANCGLDLGRTGTTTTTTAATTTQTTTATPPGTTP
jgi:hypothetical protein